jgi:hypothetical protein
MKSTTKLIIFVLTFLAVAASAYAQSPHEELQQMVDQLQKTPNDNALREKIIKLAPTLKPSPVLPDTAITFEGRAQFAFNNAKSEDDYLAAAREYEKAVAAAPWVPGYYADLCTIYEKAGKFEDARRHCGFYLTSLTDPAQMTDVKRRIAGLEFGIEKAAQAAIAKANADATAERERLRPTVEGKWTDGMVSFQVVRNGERFTIIGGTMLGSKPPITWRAQNVVADRQHLRFKGEHDNPGVSMYTLDLSLSPSGSELKGWYLESKYPKTFTRVP